MRASARKRRVFFATAIAAVALLFACSGNPGMMPPRGAIAAYAGRAAALPRYCKNYTPFSGGGGVPVNFRNASGLKTPVFVYVNAGTQYLNTNGTLESLPVGKASSFEFPLACFTGPNGKQFVIPPGTSDRIYVSFGPVVPPSNGILACCEPPNVPTGYVNENYHRLWDVLEYAYPNATGGINFDSTQVDAFAIPFVVTVRAPGQTVTVGTRRYAEIVRAMRSTKPWDSLVVMGRLDRVAMPLRVMSPDDATTQAGSDNQPFNARFPQHYFTSAAYYSHPRGYLGALLAYYKTAKARRSPNYHKIVYVPYQVYFYGNACNSSPTGGGATRCPTYYAYSDGVSHFKFERASTPSPAPGMTAAPFPASVSIPIADLGEVHMVSGIWGIPFNTATTDSVARQTWFYLYKGLVSDLNRGVAMQRGYHGAAPCARPSMPPSGCARNTTQLTVPYGANYYRNPNLTTGNAAIFNGYSKILHDNFIGGFAYGESYDDFWTQSTDISTVAAPTAIDVTITSMKL